MKTFVWCAIILLSTVALHAATIEWSKPTDFQQLVYLKTDGKGGCVVWGICTSGLARVLWLNKKGETVYDALHNPAFVYGMSLGSRGLLYSYMNGVKVETCLVDKKGKMISITDPTDHLLVTPVIVYFIDNADKKGFFLQKVPVAPPAVVTIIRYSYK